MNHNKGEMMGTVNEIHFEMDMNDNRCPKCGTDMDSSDFIGIGVQKVYAQKKDLDVPEPITVFIVRCPKCELKGTMISVMQKDSMLEATDNVWDELIRQAWITGGGRGEPSQEFMQGFTKDLLEGISSHPISRQDEREENK